MSEWAEWAEWVQILWDVTKFFFKHILKVSAFYLEKPKSFIPKKNLCQYQNQKSLFIDPIFSEGFEGIQNEMQCPSVHLV